MRAVPKIDRKILIALLTLFQLSHAEHPQVLRTPRASPLQQEKDFSPRLTHQPHSLLVKLHEPLTIECPVESQPESDVKWFRNGQVLANEPAHLEQLGSELMFFQVNSEDSGEYHCEAQNYLGRVASEHFRLAVQSNAQDETIKLEPPVYLASDQQDWPAEFHCSIPVGLLARVSKLWQQTSSNQPEKFVRWLRNGRLLPVSWALSQQNPQQQKRLFRARQSETNPSEFILNIGRPDRHLDDNSNYTCRLRWDADNQDEDLVPGHELHESRPSSLRFDSGAIEPRLPPVKFDIPMGQPIGGDIISGSPTPSIGFGATHNQNNTTQMGGSNPAQAPPGGTTNDNRIRPTLTETLTDLYQIAKPTLILLGVMSLVALIVLSQFMFVRRRAEAHRYMKHGHHHHHHHHPDRHLTHHHQYSTSSGSSANSSGACGGGANSDASADPILSGLMAWAPSASSLGAGATKKFKYHRDHMRAKVAAAGDHQLVMDEAHHDFIDAAAYFAATQNHQPQDYPGAQLLFGRTSPNPAALPNLYNQSLAAREQARSLLQAGGDHVRSMGNLTSSGQLQRLELPISKQHQMLMSNNVQRNVQHHLELPTNFAYINATSNQTGPLELNATSLMQLNQQRRQATEQYQLVSCSSVSPSSTSSVVAGSNLSSNASAAATTSGARSHRQEQKTISGQLETSSREINTNHYSIICNEVEVGRRHPNGHVKQLINDDDDDERYEEVESNVSLLRSSARSSMDSKLSFSNQQKPENSRNFNRKSSFGTAQNNDSASPSNPMAPLVSGPWRRSNRGKRGSSGRTRANNDHKQPQCPSDQLSPYAVSSICHGQQQSPLPPPVSSEAMRALTEQLDIHQLTLIDGENTNPTTSEIDEDGPRVALNLPPPPPPPAISKDNQPKMKSEERGNQLEPSR